MNQIKTDYKVHHRLLQRQIKKATSEGGAIDYEMLLDLVNSAYSEQDHNRIQHDRALAIMSMEMMEQNEELRSHRKNLEKLVEERTRELLEAKAKAEDATKAKTDFIANMSHEIRTPLNSIIGIASIISDTELSDEQENLIHIIKKSGDVLLEIINDILDVTKIEAGKFFLEAIDFSVSSCVEDITSCLMFKAQEQGIDLLVDIAPNMPDCFIGDAGRVRQIILNLLSNAIKFTKSGYVVMRVKSQDMWGTSARLNFEIEDTGIGIPEDKLDYIFNKFSQAEESTTRKFGGTGLGLVICKHLIKSMSGSIQVRSALGKGSIFSFDIALPYGKKEKLEQTTNLLEEHYTSIDLSTQSALIVDSLEINKKILGKYLERYKISYNFCSSANEALQLLDKAQSEEKPYNLLFVDRRVCEVDGVSIAKTIRSNKKFASTALILLTSSRIDNLSAHDGIRAEGFIGLLPKPYHPFQLKNLMLMVCDAWARGDSSHLITPNTMPLAFENAKEQNPEKQYIGKHILVVDDVPFNTMLLAKILKKFGVNADTIDGGKDAILQIEASSSAGNPYDLVFMDCHMPEVDGYEVTIKTRQFEESTGAKRTIIVALTADAMEENRLKSLKAGMDDFITKPINKEQISKVLGKWLAA